MDNSPITNKQRWLRMSSSQASNGQKTVASNGACSECVETLQGWQLDVFSFPFRVPSVMKMKRKWNNDSRGRLCLFCHVICESVHGGETEKCFVVIFAFCNVSTHSEHVPCEATVSKMLSILLHTVHTVYTKEYLWIKNWQRSPSALLHLSFAVESRKL